MEPRVGNGNWAGGNWNAALAILKFRLYKYRTLVKCFILLVYITQGLSADIKLYYMMTFDDVLLVFTLNTPFVCNFLLIPVYPFVHIFKLELTRQDLVLY